MVLAARNRSGETWASEAFDAQLHTASWRTGVCRRIRAGNRGSNPAKYRGKQRKEGAGVGKELTDGNGHAREIHDVSQAQNHNDGQGREAHCPESLTKLLAGHAQGDAILALLIEDAVHDGSDQTSDKEHGAGVREQVQVVSGARILPAAFRTLPARPGKGILMSVLASSAGMPSLQIANTTTTMM